MGKATIPKGLILILVLGLGFRLVNLGQSFWLDEASQAQMSSWTVSRIWAGRQNDFHPPLYYLFSHYLLLFGRSEVWLRLPSVIFGLINIYLIYLLTKKILPDGKIIFVNWKLKIEYLAGFLLAINPYHVYYSQEFRSYSLLCLLGTWSMYLLYTKKYHWLALANSLLLYTHYSSVFLILTQLVFVLVYENKNISKFLLTLALTLVLYLPWLPWFIAQLQSGINIDMYLPGWRQVLSVSMLKILPLTFFKLIAGRINFLSQYLYLIYIVFVLGVVFFTMRFVKERRNFIFTWVFLPVFLMIGFSVVFPQNQPFRVIYILPGLVLIFVQAALRFPKLVITLILYISLVGNLAYFTRPRLQREQWRQAIDFVDNRASIVRFSDRFSPQAWYSPEKRVIAAVPTFPAKADQVSQILTQSLNPADNQLYLFDYLGDLTDPHREVDLALVNLGYTRTKTHDFPGVGFVHLYLRI